MILIKMKKLRRPVPNLGAGTSTQVSGSIYLPPKNEASRLQTFALSGARWRFKVLIATFAAFLCALCGYAFVVSPTHQIGADSSRQSAGTIMLLNSGT